MVQVMNLDGQDNHANEITIYHTLSKAYIYFNFFQFTI